MQLLSLFSNPVRLKDTEIRLTTTTVAAVDKLHYSLSTHNSTKTIDVLLKCTAKHGHNQSEKVRW